MSDTRLVIQLERLGDLVQTLPALKLLAGESARTRFAVQQPLHDWAAKLVPPDVEPVAASSDHLSALLDALAHGAREQHLAPAAKKLADSLGSERPAFVVNLTWHAAGAALASAYDEQRVVGPIISGTERLNPQFWAAYPIAAVDARPFGRVHMSDVRRFLVEQALGGARSDPPEPTPEPTDERGDVVLIVGAGDRRRFWPAERWGQLAAALGAAGRRVRLAGGPAEHERGEQVAQVARLLGAPAENLCGALGPDQLVLVLQQAALVVGADTGPTHLACWLARPVVMLMAGRAHVWETGPREPGNVAVQALPVGNAAMSAIPLELVREIAMARLSGRPPSRPAGPRAPYTAAPHAGSCQVYRSAKSDPRCGLDGVVYEGHGADDDETAASRALIALLAGVAGRRPDESFASACLARCLARDPGLAEASSRAHDLATTGGGQARKAAQALAAGEPRRAVETLRSASASVEQLAEALVAHRITIPLGACLRVALEHLPAASPERVVDELASLFERAGRATALVARAASAPSTA
ncbi:MAG: glycosyltransferase family 9 protein [Acidobacteriota bacterium]|nr:MAG: glycosyltransferase family 9 protein [Acidobacteriota bacterium]